MTRSKYDELHDKVQTSDSTKAGTRYERLVAIVQKILDQTAGVTHDVKLVGELTEVPHQILQRRLTSDPPRGGFVIQCAAWAAAGAALS